MSGDAVATFNCGSSSLKFALFPVVARGIGERLVAGAISGLGSQPRLDVTGASPDLRAALEALATRSSPTIEEMIVGIAAAMEKHCPGIRLVAAGHRVVHGGPRIAGPRKVTVPLLEALDRFCVFAPDHQPKNLAGIRAMAREFPFLMQSMSFDTAFHRGQPVVAQTYAIPRNLTADGLVRYGFHGLSYQHLSGRLPKLLPDRPHRRVVALHLGSGASLCAIDQGHSIATSMGLTAASGVMMATRSGDIDPGLVLYLIGKVGLSTDEVADLLNHRSGLLGVSGISADLRVLLNNAAATAREAIELYCYRIVREVCSLAGALQGVDALVFTGGVGENAAEVRRRICEELSWLGLQIDHAANLENAAIISSSESPVAVCVLRADEERVIADETLRVRNEEIAPN